MTTTENETANPYWDEIRNHLGPSLFGNGIEINWLDHPSPLRRHDYVTRYAWTATDPPSVEFVAQHSQGRIVDRMAGTGYWAMILAAHGVDVVASDLNHCGAPYHEGSTPWYPIGTSDGATASAAHPDRTLLLSWPPYGEPVGADILAAYTGSRVIYIGETGSGCCGDEDLFDALGRDWLMIAEHIPMQWAGMHAYLQVYDRA